MSRIRLRTVSLMSANASLANVVTSPITCTCPVVTAVSTATRDFGSAASSESRIESLMASQILSGVSLGDRLAGKQPTCAHSVIPFKKT